MTQIEIAKQIIAQGGYCHGVPCAICPARKVFCTDINIPTPRDTVIWFKNWLRERETKNEVSPKLDTVNKPAHYTAGKYETKDIIEDAVKDFESYCHGNILKYIIRYRHKNGVEDLKKAQVYLGWLIERLSK